MSHVHIIERHLPDRVLRQFGEVQDVPRGWAKFMRSSREILLWGPEILVVTAEVDIHALQAVPWGWRDGPADPGTIEEYDQWWALHRLILLTDPEQPAPVER